MKTKKSFTSVSGYKRIELKEINEIKENIENIDDVSENDINTQIFDCSFKPQTIKFRELEEQEIQQFLDSQNLINFLMITGQPGSGKTMLVTRMQEKWNKQYQIIYKNAMTCKNYIEYILEVSKTLKLKCPLKGNSIIKSTFRTAIKKLSEKKDIMLIIDEFDNLFRNNDKDSFDLFMLCQNQDIKIIGISNDIEFLQIQSMKFKFQLPELKNIILVPYTQVQLSELVLDRIQDNFQIEEQAIKLLTAKAYNEKGGDMRNVLDICKRVLRNKKLNQTITKEDYNSEIGQNAKSQKFSQVLQDFSLQNQLILLGMYLINKQSQTKYNGEQEIELPNLIRKVNEVQYRLGLTMKLDMEESLKFLQDYNIIKVREIRQSKCGFKFILKKISCKLDADEVKYHLDKIEGFGSIWQQ